MEQSSSFVQHQPFQLHLLHQEFQLDKLLYNGEEHSKSKGRRKSCVQVATSSDEYVFFYLTSSSAASSPIATKSAEMPIASGKPDSRMSVEPSSFDAASTSQVMHTFAGKWKSSRETRRIKKKKIQKTPTVLRLEPGHYTEEPVAQNNKAWVKPLAQGASSSVDQESQNNTEATWDHYLHISPDTSHYMEAVFSVVRKIYGKQPGDPLEDLNMDLVMW